MYEYILKNNYMISSFTNGELYRSKGQTEWRDKTFHQFYVQYVFAVRWLLRNAMNILYQRDIKNVI